MKLQTLETIQRTTLRLSGLAFIFMLVLTSILEETPILEEIRRHAKWSMMPLPENAGFCDVLFKVYNCSFICIYLITPILMITLSRTATDGLRKRVYGPISVFAFLLSLLPPVWFMVFQVTTMPSAPMKIISGGLCMIQIATCAYLAFRGVRSKNKGVYVIWINTCLFISSLVGILALFIRLIALIHLYVPPGEKIRTLFSGAGLVQFLAFILTMLFSVIWVWWIQTNRNMELAQQENAPDAKAPVI